MRLSVTVILEIVLLSLFIPYLLIDFLIPLIIMLANFINKPIEYFIGKHYIKKAKAPNYALANTT